ncbi:substrate-binding domain-containing protein [Bradyrhizobium sp.]|uniref:substrate-binding domain-containing protein n=1 Tax=Bradyrhizobium sp. TaxID=376 RepID=UPI003C722F58
MPGMMQRAAVVFTVGFWAAGGMAQADEVRFGGTGAAQGIMLILGKAFSAVHPGDALEVVSGLGSSGGIAAVAEGALMLSVSGRPLKQEEKAKGLDSFPFIDTPFLFVTSNTQNLNLTTADVVAIYNGTITKWPDNRQIKPILRPKSDTASAFLIANIPGMQSAMDKIRQRTDVPIAATDQDNLQAAEAIEASFAGMTLTQFIADRPRLRAIMLDGVQPSVDNMLDGKYSLKTTLHLVMRAQPSAATQRFIAFVRTPQAQKLIRENGGVLVSTRTEALQ